MYSLKIVTEDSKLQNSTTKLISLSCVTQLHFCHQKRSENDCNQQQHWRRNGYYCRIWDLSEAAAVSKLASALKQFSVCDEWKEPPGIVVHSVPIPHFSSYRVLSVRMGYEVLLQDAVHHGVVHYEEGVIRR